MDDASVTARARTESGLAPVNAFLDNLALLEKSAGTIAKYGRDLDRFFLWLGDAGPSREALLEYKKHLISSGRSARSVNAALCALNGYLAFAGRPDLRLSLVRIQRQVFRDRDSDLTKADYVRLVDAAYASGRLRLGLVMETLGSTGIRISELRYVTVEAILSGRFEVDLKGKRRVVMLPDRLLPKLDAWRLAHGIESGPIFLTRNGRILSRQEVWRGMKALCHEAGVPDSKVYPHNFRHMFATVFYSSCKDIVRLADVLGHSSVDTTRLYLISSGEAHARQLARMDLVR